MDYRLTSKDFLPKFESVRLIGGLSTVVTHLHPAFRVWLLLTMLLTLPKAVFALKVIRIRFKTQQGSE